ncbi:MAG: cation:proton antiporter [Alphaproteobacteria bacterium]|nr:cation:proton antiporter [Alphaproteobacteria bacterium]
MDDLTALAVMLAAAVVAGLLMNRVRMPAVAGFILVGVVLGPTGLGLIEHSTSIETLADLGVLMLLFILGMELRLASFRKLLPLALGIATAEVVLFTLFTTGLAQLTRGETTSAVVIGFMLAISSTAVAIKMMEDAQEAQTPAGKLTVAILVAQDLAVVPLLLLTNAMAPHAGPGALAGAGLKLLIAVGLLAGFITMLTRVKSFRFPFSEFFLKDFDVGTLGVLAVCFVAAAVSGLLGLSPALGAFIGGMAVGHSTLRRTAIGLAQPVQSILLFVFFLSVGLLIDLHYVVAHLWLIVIVLAVVTVGKTALNAVLLHLAGQPGEAAFPAALFLSPVGEFSFVLASAGAAAGALTPEGHKLAIAVIALSLLVSPLWFVGARRAHALALRGITETDALFQHSYARELFFLRHWGGRAARAGAAAVANAAAVGTAAVQSTQSAASRRVPPTVVAEAHDVYAEPFGDIGGPGILPTTPKRQD